MVRRASLALITLAFLLPAGCRRIGEVTSPEIPDCTTPSATVTALLKARQGLGGEARFFTSKARDQALSPAGAGSFEIVEEIQALSRGARPAKPGF